MEKVFRWLEVSQSLEGYVINEKIIDSLRELDKNLKDNEFVVYAEGEVKEKRLYLDKEIIIPPQSISPDEVTPYWVPSDGFWAFFHKHPYPFIHFSGMDQIYTHMYPFSVAFLWCGGHLVQAMHQERKIELQRIEYSKGELKKAKITQRITITDEVTIPFICDKRFIERGLLTINNKSWKLYTSPYLFITAV